MNKYLQNLNWRYATKKFDSSRSLSPEQLDFLKEAIRLTASSLGLQPYEIYIVSDPHIRTKLQSASWNQPQITEASHLFVFCAKKNIADAEIESYLELVSSERDIKRTDLEGYANMIRGAVTGMSMEDLTTWSAKQCYIALGNLLSACAVAHIDACPMEGFSADAYNEILNLDSHNLTATVVAAVGFRSTEDKYQHLKKVRKSTETLFKEL